MSLPNTSLNTSQTIVDLQEKVKELSYDLQSAHQEIENLNNENFRLKSDLQNHIKTIETLKKISLTTTKTTPRSGSKRRSIRHENLTAAGKNVQLFVDLDQHTINKHEEFGKAIIPLEIDNKLKPTQQKNLTPEEKNEQPLLDLQQHSINMHEETNKYNNI